MFVVRKINFCFILSILIVLLFVIPTKYLNLSTEDKMVINEILSHHDEEFQSLSLRVSNVKKLEGRNKESLKLVELSPTGYIILSGIDGNAIEYCLDKPSPYLNYEDSIIYGGPSTYLVQKRNELVKIQQNKKTYELSSGKTDSPDICVPDDPMDGYPEVTKENVINFFKNMTSPGTPITPDTCGYIGLGLLIAFQAKFYNSLFLSTEYWENSSETQLIAGASSIGQHLYNLNPHSLTTASIIGFTLNEYCSEVGISAVSFFRLLPQVDMIREYDDIIFRLNRCIPVQLFGSYDNNGKDMNHSVVAYAYENNMFRVHLGWDGISSTSVFISSSDYFIGEMMSIDRLN